MERSPLGPLARKEELTIEDLPSETVVYDRTRNRMHCLNRSTSFIWRRCDGNTKIEEIAAHLPEVGLPADPDVVRRALKALNRAHLLAGGTASFNAALPSRRQLVQRLGLAAGSAAALLPAITSAAAPTPATAKSKDGHDKKPKKPKKDDLALRFD
jgi:hypothetical protein